MALFVCHAIPTVILLLLSYCCDALYLSAKIIPVLHNLSPELVPRVLDAIPTCIRCLSVSLRHSGSMDGLESAIVYSNSKHTHLDRHIGASTAVSTTQIGSAYKVGSSFISTTRTSKSLIEATINISEALREMRMISGVLTQQDVELALSTGSDMIKFYPSTEISPAELRKMFINLQESGTISLIENDVYYKNKRLPIFMSGGVRLQDISQYIASGVDGFAVGIDCLEDPAEINKKLVAFVNEYTLNQVNKESTKE